MPASLRPRAPPFRAPPRQRADTRATAPTMSSANVVGCGTIEGSMTKLLAPSNDVAVVNFTLTELCAGFNFFSK